MTVLWAWERPEHLNFIDPQATGVAFLDRTIAITQNDVRVRPRYQPLVVPNGTPLVAVIRVESAKDAELSESQRARSVTEIVAAARPGISAIQIDFDALQSERTFFAQLLGDVRAALPHATGLQITALASWCLGDPWIRDLPIDDAVPMLFRMGADAPNVERTLNGGGDFALAVCRHSVGISTDEQSPRVPSGRRRYVFNPRAWSRDALESLMKRIAQ
jgi:hypothetical protein